jgi:hypothetical protein
MLAETRRHLGAFPEAEESSMSNPFSGRSLSLNGPATDLVPVLPSDTVDLPDVGLALYVETGGVVSMVTVAGQSRVVTVADFSILPVGVARINATGTTANGLHALVLA